MTEEKLIEMLWKNFWDPAHGTGWIELTSKRFGEIIHEALAAKGMGCADAFYSFDPQPLQLDGDDKRLGDAILNAEPLEEVTE